MSGSSTRTVVSMVRRCLALCLWPLLICGCGRDQPLQAASTAGQPIQFSHKRHAGDQGMDCVECHQFVMKNRKATLPGRDVCAECHSEPQGSSPEEKKLVDLLSSGQDLNWQRVYVLPKHVYFSHFRHVTLGQIGCQTCHGMMKELTEPPREPAVNAVDMSFCIKCHRERRVSEDCLACHT